MSINIANTVLDNSNSDTDADGQIQTYNHWSETRTILDALINIVDWLN